MAIDNCEDWIERDGWRPARYADALLGHRSGCFFCFDERVLTYQKNKAQDDLDPIGRPSR